MAEMDTDGHPRVSGGFGRRERGHPGFAMSLSHLQFSPSGSRRTDIQSKDHHLRDLARSVLHSFSCFLFSLRICLEFEIDGKPPRGSPNDLLLLALLLQLFQFLFLKPRRKRCNSSRNRQQIGWPVVRQDPARRAASTFVRRPKPQVTVTPDGTGTYRLWLFPFFLRMPSPAVPRNGRRHTRLDLGGEISVTRGV